MAVEREEGGSCTSVTDRTAGAATRQDRHENEPPLLSRAMQLLRRLTSRRLSGRRARTWHDPRPLCGHPQPPRAAGAAGWTATGGETTQGERHPTRPPG